MRHAALLTCSFALSTLAAPPAHAATMCVAVMEFTNASRDPELESLGKGLQSMVTTDLANVQALQVVERERLKDVQGELQLSRGQGFDKTTAAKIGKLIGATHLFVGSYTVVGDKMRLDGRMITIATGDIVVAEQIAGEKALFFELEQLLVQKVIALLGVKVQPKEKAALSKAHTADFGAFRKFSDGIQAFDDGRVEAAIKALNEATAIDKDFKLASLTLEEYERLAAKVRTKAEAAGRVEDEVSRLERNKAIASGVAVLKKLWPILDTKGNAPDTKLRRVAAACALSDAYRSELGYKNRGPVTGEDLVAAGFDDFTLHRTADALFARAWSEAPDVFPRLPPLCIGLHMVSADNPRPIDELLGYHIADAQKLTPSTSTSTYRGGSGCGRSSTSSARPSPASATRTARGSRTTSRTCAAAPATSTARPRCSRPPRTTPGSRTSSRSTPRRSTRTRSSRSSSAPRRRSSASSTCSAASRAITSARTSATPRSSSA
ncbi:MAG: hypothetical protein E6J91_39860 [Deltaproteobacteria bacterium]|nr:MAG: hypothetical protein E6J91_39860 [Deltaproteobacteria bacterium]